MSNARALIIATKYAEPFGFVVIEALMSGTPVICSNWGAFVETVPHGIVGYRCQTLDHYIWAIHNIDKINPQACRDWAMANYSLTKVRTMYEEYFDMVLSVKIGKGYYHINSDRSEMNWLQKEYPVSVKETIKSKPKILIISETAWACGRIANALSKFSTKFIMDTVNYVIWKTYDKKFIDKYDLIYIPLWHAAHDIIHDNPNIANKIVFSAHSVFEFLDRSLPTSGVTSVNKLLTKESTEHFDVDITVINWLKNRKLPMSAVSHQMINKLIDQNVYLTQCGYDPDIFFPTINSNNDRLQVLFPYPKILHNWMGNHFNPKRPNLVMQIKARIEKENYPIDIIIPDNKVPLTDMQELYNNHDVFLCVSHTEGNPLGAFESGACGLVVVTTNVGEMMYFIEDGENGFLIDNGSDDEIVDAFVEKLLKLTDRELLNKMKAKMLDRVGDWSWNKKINQWDDFFEDALEISKS